MEIIVPTVVYGGIVVKIAPVVSDRYIMCLFPFLAMVSAVGIVDMVRHFVSTTKFFSFLTIALTGIYVICNLLFMPPNYLYSDEKKLKLGIEKERALEMNCLVVTDENYRVFPEVNKLTKFNQVMVVKKEDIEIVKKERPQNDQRELLVFVYEGIDEREVLNCVIKSYGKNDVAEKISGNLRQFNTYILK